MYSPHPLCCVAQHQPCVTTEGARHHCPLWLVVPLYYRARGALPPSVPRSPRSFGPLLCSCFVGELGGGGRLDHQKGGRTVAVTHDHLSGLPPGNGSSRGSQEQASSPRTRREGAQRHDRAPVTPLAAAPHVEAAVLTLVAGAGAAVVVVGSAGHLATGSAVRPQGPRQVEFTGADPGQDPTPKGGPVPHPLQTPKWLYRTMGFVRAGGAGDFVLGIWQGEILVFDPMCLYSK